MKIIYILLAAILLLVPAAPVSAETNYSYNLFNGHKFDIDDIELRLDDGDVILYNKLSDDEVIISDEFELIINGLEIELDPQQRILVKECHTIVYDIIDEAVKIGLEGGKIGLEGAGLGIKAIGGILKMLLTSYDEDDLDRDMERAAEKLEKKAEALEERAEEVEDMVKDLEDVYEEMFDVIPALAELDWQH